MIGEYVQTVNGLRLVKGVVGERLLLVDSDGRTSLVLPDRVVFFVDKHTKDTFRRIGEDKDRAAIIEDFSSL